MATVASAFAELVAQHFDWADWEALIGEHGITIDRPYRSHHPHFADIIYPLDYGYVNHTMSSDGDEVDVFVGSAENGLVGLLLTTDHRKGDHEMKLLYHCTP
ncbi:MAG TPA: inorganic diphosphatase, partial [Rhodothermales bacterium]|nr:inorganic diphosphatase [Rhodothermales bacterium]